MKIAKHKMIEVHDHIVCGEMEIDELVHQGVIREVQAKDPRHDLFLKIKHPGQRVFKGGWGPELLMFSDQGDPHIGKVGRIHCSYLRYKEIAEWFLANMFQGDRNA